MADQQLPFIKCLFPLCASLYMYDSLESHLEKFDDSAVCNTCILTNFRIQELYLAILKYESFH